MRTVDIELEDGKKAIGIRVPLPKAPLILVYTKKGFIMCGYLDINTAEKLKLAAGIVREVKTIDRLLNTKLDDVTSTAKRFGIKRGMLAREALQLLS